jgi:hypothetical protein
VSGAQGSAAQAAALLRGSGTISKMSSQEQGLSQRVLRLQRIRVSRPDNRSAFEKAEPKRILGRCKLVRSDEQVADGHAVAQMAPHQRRNAAQQNVSAQARLPRIDLLLRFTRCRHCILYVYLAVLQLQLQPRDGIMQPEAAAHVRHVAEPARFFIVR